MVSDNIDFHPTDVIEDADGSLLIVDTGGWYKLCCPTSQLVKPDVTGAIYRVRRDDAFKPDDPRGLKTDWKALHNEGLTFGHFQQGLWPATSARVADEVARRGEKVVRDMRLLLLLDPNVSGVAERVCATWAVSRIDAPGARAIIRELIKDPQGGATLPGEDETLRRPAIYAAGLWRDKEAAPVLIAQLGNKDLHTRRAAAAALGRIGSAKAVPALLTALADETNDRVLDHALTFALIEIGDAKETAKGLSHKSPRVRRACLAALENIPDNGLDAKTVLAELDAPDAALRETAWWIAGRHPQWGDQLADYFTTKLKTAAKLKPAGRDELAARLGKFVGNAAVQKVLGGAIAEAESAKLSLGVMARSGLKTLPTVWRDSLLSAAPNLEDRDALKAALGVFRALPAEAKDYDAFVAKLPRLKLWPGGVVPDEFRLALIAARPAGQALDVPTLSYLFGKLDRDESPADRATAADVLLRAKLSVDQLAALAAALKTASPLDLAKLLNVFAKTTDQTVGLALVKALREKNVRATLRTEMVKPILDKYPKPVTDEAEKLYAELAQARKGETAKLDKALAELKPGDVRRGQLVFNGAKTQCVACHKVGYVGGTSGPDLTKIGSVRSERDLLESILFPSASFVRSYEPVRVITTDQRTLNGVLKKDAPDEIVIVIAADKEERVARADVESVSPSAVSLMPGGLEGQLTPQELADLIAFLRACK